MEDVERKMPDYLANREAETGEPFVGIASDGRAWRVLALDQGKLVKIKETTLNPDKPEEFIAWLDGALALKVSLPPDPSTVRIELGAGEVAFRTAETALRGLWDRLKVRREILLKRQLWAQLLKIVYGKDVESDPLWLQHTYLVIVAKCIAFAVLGINEDDPGRLLSGEALATAGINGAVASDFFDWIVADPEGANLVRRIMAHVRRFRLAEVESDVMKTLYELLIDQEQRHGLGEYYTPDWLAAKMTRHAISAPLEQKVLDPACGSGTFLFHALRRFLEEADTGDVAPARRALEATHHVAGMDIHPVAVIIARVTYLLGLAPALSGRAGAISVPVYLGDAMQLSISEMIGGRELSIRVPPPPAGEGKSGERDGNGREQLDFPDAFCRDPGLFDKAIERMRSGSEQGMTRDADRGGAQPHHGTALSRRRHRRAEARDRGPRQDLSRLRQAQARRPRLDLGLCRAQPITPARLFRWRRMGECSDRQPAMGRLSPHERRSAKAVQGAGEGRGRLRCQSSVAERLICALYRPLSLALPSRRRSACLGPAPRGADARPIRTVAIRIVPRRRDSVG